MTRFLPTAGIRPTAIAEPAWRGPRANRHHARTRKGSRQARRSSWNAPSLKKGITNGPKQQKTTPTKAEKNPNKCREYPANSPEAAARTPRGPRAPEAKKCAQRNVLEMRLRTVQKMPPFNNTSSPSPIGSQHAFPLGRPIPGACGFRGSARAPSFRSPGWRREGRVPAAQAARREDVEVLVGGNQDRTLMFGLCARDQQLRTEYPKHLGRDKPHFPHNGCGRPTTEAQGS